MKRRAKSDTGSLDSLLDTMTNVVGILVIVLVVTQLGVRDAVSRISQSDLVSPEAIAREEAKLTEIAAEHDQLEATVKSLSTPESATDIEQLIRRRDQLRIRVAQLTERLQQEQQQAAAAQAAAKKEIELAKKRREELLAEIKKLEKELQRIEEILAKLRAQLAVVPLPAKTPAREILLPNPRPAPKDATPLTFLCRSGRVIPVDAANLQDKAQKRAKFIVSRRKLGTVKARGIDGKLLVKYFNQTSLRNAYFDAELYIHGGRYPRLRLTRRKNVGDTAADLTRATSSYKQLVRRIPPGKHYLQFLVWPDSYEAYLHARRLATERGLLAGWIPTSTAEEHTIPLGGPLRVGPPPKPVKPKPVDPNAKPKPPPKPKPVDTID